VSQWYSERLFLQPKSISLTSNF